MTIKKRAMITGITGQDGSYLAKLLLKKEYEVHGLVRPCSNPNYWRISDILNDITLHECDMNDSATINNKLFIIQPDEVYHLAAQSHVGKSFDLPEYTTNITAIGTLRILEGIRTLGLGQKTKFYQASSSEMYGNPTEFPQNEQTPFNPASPYAIAKLHAHLTTKHYRETYNLFACNGILFNHESPMRGETFVTTKITKSLCRIVLGIDDELILGNLNAERDWGHAEEYVEMQWAMLQLEEPEDFVIATGEKFTVRQFLSITAENLGIELEYKGHGLEEVAVVKKIKNPNISTLKPGKIIVRVSEKYFRANEVNALLGDPRKAMKNLNWKPIKTIYDISKEMIEHELKNINVNQPVLPLYFEKSA